MAKNIWSMKLSRIIKVVSVNVIMTALLVEISSLCYILFKKPYIGYLEQFPTYLNLNQNDEIDPFYDPLAPHIIDTAYPWATWHPRNKTYRQKRKCFDILMRFNEEGTRGAVPDSSDPRTVFFLGDSFVEGYGLAEDSTLPAQYMRVNEVPVFNLGVSGFGTTQYSLLYRGFAERYKHGKVFVVMYLSNDFLNNRIEGYAGRHENSKRYIPYRADSNDLSKITYKGSPSTSLFSWQSFKNGGMLKERKVQKMSIRTYLNQSSWSFAKKVFYLTYSSRLLFHIRLGFEKKGSSEIFPTPNDYRILEYDLKDIIRRAESHGATVTVTNIPDRVHLRDMMENVDMERRYLEIESKVNEIVGKGNHRFVSFYGFLNDNKIGIDSIYLSCDSHLNPNGTQLLADFLSSGIRP